jgi:hypothetical protein
MNQELMDMAVKAGIQEGEFERYKGEDGKRKAYMMLPEELEAFAALVAAAEPVAWHDKIMGMEVSMDVSTGEDDIDRRVYGQVYEVILSDGGGTPDVILAIKSAQNYTTPQQRPWVGLTDEDQFNLVHAMNENDWDAIQMMDAIEAKLKEKNA